MHREQQADAGQTGMRIGIRVGNEQERRHLERVIGMAARRSGLALQHDHGDAMASADIVIVRRGEPGSSQLLDKGSPGKPVPVVYTDNAREHHRWRLDWPARTDDLIRLLDGIRRHLGNDSPREGNSP